MGGHCGDIVSSVQLQNEVKNVVKVSRQPWAKMGFAKNLRLREPDQRAMMKPCNV
jgi:hypothetical protein